MRTTGNENHPGECRTLPWADAVQIESLIVIAEEQPAIRELLRWILHLADYRATVCVDRQAALTWGEQSMAPGNMPVMLLLDVSLLGVQEEADFLRCVRARWQNVCGVLPQIIVLTTNARVPVVLEKKECVLQKPFHVLELLTVIQQAIHAATRSEDN